MRLLRAHHHTQHSLNTSPTGRTPSGRHPPTCAPGARPPSQDNLPWPGAASGERPGQSAQPPGVAQRGQGLPGLPEAAVQAAAPGSRPRWQERPHRQSRLPWRARRRRRRRLRRRLAAAEVKLPQCSRVNSHGGGGGGARGRPLRRLSRSEPCRAASGPVLSLLPELPGGGCGRRVWEPGQAGCRPGCSPVPAAPSRPTPRGCPGGRCHEPGEISGRVCTAGAASRP